MSYILEALKKSEQQRNSINMAASTATITPPAASGKRRFGLPLLLLAIALAVGWFFAPVGQTLHHQPPAAVSKPANTPIAPVTPASGKPEIPISSLQPTAHTATVSTSKSSQSPAISPTPEPADVPTASSPGHHIPISQSRQAAVPVFKPITPESSFSRVDASLPDIPSDNDDIAAADTSITSFSALPLAVRQSLPAINIEGHIYDENPAARMVIINGDISREKQAVSGGLKLEEITPNGVILSYRGHVFHIGVFEK